MIHLYGVKLTLEMEELTVESMLLTKPIGKNDPDMHIVTFKQFLCFNTTNTKLNKSLKKQKLLLLRLCL